MSAKTVFISYRRDATGKAFARNLKQALKHQGYDAFMDVDDLNPGQWAAQILSQVPKQAHFLLLLTPGALERCAGKDDWVQQEFLLAVQSGRNIVPVREESVELASLRESCPESVSAIFGYQIATIHHGSFENDLETLISRYIPPHRAPAPSDEPPRQPRTRPVDISRIIKYAPVELIGREAETALLNDAWSKVRTQEPKRPHVLTFVALGGEGKTSLVAKWAADLAHRDWPGCDAVFAWSFYSQGTREQVAASSDLFLKEALTFFGDAALAGSAQGAFDKGRRLAQLVGERRALLILDGLEPLQYAPTSPTPGELKDQGLAALLKGLAATSHGLCVVTTRYAIPDLRAFLGKAVREEKLTRLSQAAGVALLKTLDVKGTAPEFEKLVEDVQGHALTLNLLGSYLRDAHAGDIRRRDLVKLEEADAEEQGGHAFRVMDAYVLWFRNEGDKGHRAIAVLRILGLFDRPATAGCLAALQKAPAISGMTKGLVGISEAQWNMTLSQLEKAKLLSVNRDAATALVSLDTHALIRAYFASERSTQHSEAWRAAHRRLYEHLCAATREGDAPTLDELQPLYQAVAHGCQAGLQQEAAENIYYHRILRRRTYYSMFKLGAWSSDLGAIACFFERPWRLPSHALSSFFRAWMLNNAAVALRSLGRLSEALDPMRAGLEMRIEQENWNQAAASANNLAELELALGKLAAAAATSEQAMIHADRAGDPQLQSAVRTIHADVLHQTGRLAEAELNFLRAEEIEAERHSAYPILCSLQGFRYCELLLSDAERAAWRIFFSCVEGHQAAVCYAVSQRASQALKWAESSEADILSAGLDRLTLGRAALYAEVLHSGSGNLPKKSGDNMRPETLAAFNSAHAELDASVIRLRRADAQDYLPHGLLTRAWLRFLTGSGTGPESAQSDLDEAWEIAERGPMPLFLADIHLHRARLFFRETPYPWNQHPDGTPRGPKDDLAAARRLIEKHGYWRRKEELEDAEEAAKSW